MADDKKETTTSTTPEKQNISTTDTANETKDSGTDTKASGEDYPSDWVPVASHLGIDEDQA